MIDDFVKSEIAKNVANQEHFIAQYLKATGARIQDTEMVMQYTSDGAIYFCRPVTRPRRQSDYCPVLLNGNPV